MLTADSADRSNTHKIAFITGASIFVMGYLNGIGLDTYGKAVMISAQSGNVVWMGLNAAGGYWIDFLENMGLFFGFMAGAIFALYTQSIFKHRSKQFFYNWTAFVIPIILYPLIMQYVIPPFIAIFVLGFVSGAALGFFRKMYHMEINNAMATGSVRFLGLHFAGAFMKKNKKEVATFWVFFACVFLFAAGSFLYAMLARVDYSILGQNGMILSLGEIQAGRLSLGILEGPSDWRHSVGVERVIESNIARVVGLIAICIIPYFFCPKNIVAEQK
ncbi:MAG: DUF1275 domain-containing protein [Treponema sp.]|nr:DUF1275 domain-containing protein [Treponema sp.]